MKRLCTVVLSLSALAIVLSCSVSVKAGTADEEKRTSPIGWEIIGGCITADKIDVTKDSLPAASKKDIMTTTSKMDNKSATNYGNSYDKDNEGYIKQYRSLSAWKSAYAWASPSTFANHYSIPIKLVKGSVPVTVQWVARSDYKVNGKTYEAGQVIKSVVSDNETNKKLSVEKSDVFNSLI